MYPKSKAGSWNGLLRSPKHKSLNKLSSKTVFGILAGMLVLGLLIQWQSGAGFDYNPGDDDDQEPQWNLKAYSFQPVVSDWDEQRAIWTQAQPDNRSLKGEVARLPRVLMVTGSSPDLEESPHAAHLLLKAGKNKLDYCRMHDIDFFYNLGNPPAPEFDDWWMKLPVLRKLMLQHKEMEWIWWIDADVIVTDLSFQLPFEVMKRVNLVLPGNDQLVYGEERSSPGLSASTFLIRNCQWSLDLLDAWASMRLFKTDADDAVPGPENGENGEGAHLEGNPFEAFRWDDDLLLANILKMDRRMRVGKRKWSPLVKLVKNKGFTLDLSRGWQEAAPEFEKLSRRSPAQIPTLVHFAGCLPSYTAAKPDHELSAEVMSACTETLERALGHGDNQVFEPLGLRPRNIERPLDFYVAVSNQFYKPENLKAAIAKGGPIKGYRLLPRFKDWDARRAAWAKKERKNSLSTAVKDTSGQEEASVILLSGSAPKSCEGKVGNHMLLRGLKILTDYGRINRVKVFYSKSALDEELPGWWSKIPLLRMLMVNNPSVEWIWWMDSDAFVTDMEFRLPFGRFDAEGYNMVLYGNDDLVFNKHSYMGINSGNFVIRNCQWSLDLIDRWASFGATRELRVKNTPLLDALLTDRPGGWVTDDQCVLTYLLITERERWASQVHFERTIVMSGTWNFWLERIEKQVVENVMDSYRPFVNHFAGCKPCETHFGGECREGMMKLLNYADNQVLERYGLRHVSLNSTVLENIPLSAEI